MKTTAALVALLALAACGAESDGVEADGGFGGGGGGGGGGGAADAGAQCSTSVQLSPNAPRVGVDETVRATASVLDVAGTITYSWQATLDGVTVETDQAAADNSAIDIPITTKGTLHVMLSLGNQDQCSTASSDVDVLPTTFLTASYRLRIVPPPASGLPASDQIVQVHGGVDTFMPVGLESGIAFTDGTVVDATGSGVAAYVRMTPVAAQSAIVETYSAPSGAIPPLRVLGQQHAALVIPTDQSLAPAIVQWFPGSPGVPMPFAVSGGTAVTGVIHDPSGGPLVGATVALSIGGVPSSVGVTGGTGAFTLHAMPAMGQAIAITVTPPTASGLPRLVASPAAIALASPWTITYAPGLTTRDLSTVHVTRNSAPVANAPVAIVGALPGTAGTISDGTTSLPAAGDVHLALATDANGVLSGRAPAAALSLAVTRATDVSVSGFDLTAAAPASVTSAAPVTVTGTTQTSGGAVLGGTHISAVGVGALAGTTLETDADPTTGQFALALAGGGSYTLQVSDPAGRAVPLVQPLATPSAGDLGALQLPSTVHLAGTLSAGGATSLAGTAIQLLCSGCTSASDTPIAETAADANGRFRLAVPDPGSPPPQSAPHRRLAGEPRGTPRAAVIGSDLGLGNTLSAVKWLLVTVLLVVLAPPLARADDGGAVALLPLDADAKLELYGQPVASEVARALVAGGIDVVVVGPKMAVPERARLIVDGKISAGKGDAVVVALRIRDRDSGSVLDSLSATAVALTSIDQAAADVSARVLPAVKARLAARAAKALPVPPVDKPLPPVAKSPPPAAAQPVPILVGIGGSEPLRAALAEAAVAWLQQHHREPRAVPAEQLAGPFAQPTLAKEHVRAGLALDVIDYSVEPGQVPLARARVHVRLADAEHVLFDRVIVTDTIVGDRDQPAAALAERCAREVLAILAPNALRAMPEPRRPVSTRATQLALALALVAGAATTARAEAPRELAAANAAAAAGDWPRVLQLLAPLQTLQIAPADRAEAERLSGLAAYFQNQLPAAEHHFLEFLRIDPDGSLDPALYPPEALAFLEGVKIRHRAEIVAQRPPPRRYFVLNFVPVVAQVQNGETSKGIVLGGVLGTLLGAQLTTYLVLKSWCSETSMSGVVSATCDDNSNHVHAATELRTANLMLGGAAILTYVFGVYDGVTHYRARSRVALHPTLRDDK